MMFPNVPPHFGQEYANQELEWLPTDTEENFRRLMQDPDHREYFARLGWDQPRAITYRFNSHGFRADEFDSGPYLLALGCSYTIGIGLPDSCTWPRLVSNRLGLRCANLAWGGYSADTCYRLAEYWVDTLQPDYVCMLAPPRHRIELLLAPGTNNSTPFEVFLPQSQSSLFNSNDIFMQHWFLNSENAEINLRKNTRALQQLCREQHIPCTVIDAENHMWRSREEIGYARDFMHGGPDIHEILAEKFIDAYQK